MLELGWTLNPMTDILIRKKRKTEGRDICEDRAVVGDRIPKPRNSRSHQKPEEAETYGFPRPLGEPGPLTP